MAVERNKRKWDGFLANFSVWMAAQPNLGSPKTRQQYRLRIQQLQELAREGGYSLLAGDERVVRYCLMKLKPTSGTQNHAISSLLALYDFLVDERLREDNPARQLRRPPQRKGLPRPLSVEACEAYLATARGLRVEQHALACLGLYQGLRADEIRTAGWAGFFRADGREWYDLIGKGSKRARLPLHTETVQTVARLRAACRDATWLFPSPRLVNRPVSYRTLQLWHYEILEEGNIGRVTLHQLRHSYATYLRRRTKADQAIVQKGMRHASSQSTEVYMEVLDDELAECIDELSYSSVPVPASVG